MTGPQALVAAWMIMGFLSVLPSAFGQGQAMTQAEAAEPVAAAPDDALFLRWELVFKF